MNIRARKIITNVVKNRLTDYLGFDVDLLYKEADYVAIFGGSVRDSINGDTINDVDILCLYNSAKILVSALTEQGYKEVEYIKKDMVGLYKDIKAINEPTTYIKGGSVVQIIKPALEFGENNIYKAYSELLYNVDLSCCGVYYDGIHVKESINESIYRIMLKDFHKVHDAKMISEDRIIHRINKMTDRGWNYYESWHTMPDIDINIINNYIKVMERDVTIDSILT